MKIPAGAAVKAHLNKSRQAYLDGAVEIGDLELMLAEIIVDKYPDLDTEVETEVLAGIVTEELFKRIRMKIKYCKRCLQFTPRDKEGRCMICKQK